MARRSKHDRYKDNACCDKLIEPGKHVYGCLRGRWNSDYFRRKAPITAELGCGKGEYTLGLALRFPDRNFVGIDRKGARLWVGSQTAAHKRLPHVAFLRARVEQLPLFFVPGELSCIHLIFPDPYPKDRHAARRLSAVPFLRMYQQLLSPQGEIILKTDAQHLYLYTLAQLKALNISPQVCSEHLHQDPYYATQEDQGLMSTYEQRALAADRPIYYIRFGFLATGAPASLSSSRTSAKKP